MTAIFGDHTFLSGLSINAELRAEDVTVDAATGYVSWSGLTRLRAHTDGTLKLSNNAETDFNLLQFGGTTSAFPAIRRVGENLQIYRADEGGLASLYANSFWATNGVRVGSTVAARLYWEGSTRITAPSDGVLEVTNDATTSFDRIQLGGSTASYPAIQVNGTEIDFVLADGSARTSIAVDNLILDADRDAYLHAPGDDTIWWHVGGADRFFTGASSMGSLNADGPAMTQAAGTTSAPSLMPRRSDSDTGISHTGTADQLVAVVGGVDMLTLVQNDAALDEGTFKGRLTIDTPTSADGLVLEGSGDGSVITFYDSINTCHGYVGSTEGILTGASADSLGMRAEGELWFASNGNQAALRIDTSGNIEAQLGQFLAQNGSAASPAYAFGNYTHTGVYSVAGGLAFSTLGTARWSIGSSSGTLGAVDPGVRLHSGGGTESLPGYAFNVDTDTGMYRAGADILGLVTGGSEALRIDTTQQVLIGQLDVSGVFIPPKMTTTERDNLTAEAGMVIYNTTTNKHQGYNGSTWNDFY